MVFLNLGHNIKALATPFNEHTLYLGVILVTEISQLSNITYDDIRV